MNHLIGTHTLIGGTDLAVHRTEQGIVKIAHDEKGRAQLANDRRMIEHLSGFGMVPEVYDWTPDSTRMEDLGPNLHQRILEFPEAHRRPSLAAMDARFPIVDGERWRRNCTRMLWRLRQARIRHADLTPMNMAIRGEDEPVIYDFHSSHLFDEPPPDRQTSDSFLLWNRQKEFPSQLWPADSPRIIRRWLAVMGDLGGNTGVANLEGKTLLDLGCFAGDFCGMAAADGMIATGVDLGGFNAEYDSLSVARALWGEMACEFSRVDLRDWWHAAGGVWDVVLVFSTWSYLVWDAGEPYARRWLAETINHAGVLYFENQLAGDGPGPAFFAEDADVVNYLGQFGEVAAIATIPVTGRPHSRTVFRVRP